MNNQIRIPTPMVPRMKQDDLHEILNRVNALEGNGHADEVVDVHCNICSKQLLIDSSFDGNVAEARELTWLMQDQLAELQVLKDCLRLAKIPLRLRREIEMKLDDNYCRQHIMFQLNLDFKNHGCPAIAHALPRSGDLVEFRERAKQIMEDRHFQGLLLAGNSHLQGRREEAIADFRAKGYSPTYAEMRFAENFLGLYCPGYYGHEGSSTILNLAMSTFTWKKINGEPLAEIVNDEKSYVDFLRFVVVPTVGHALIKEDMSRMQCGNSAVSDDKVELIMGITAHVSYTNIFRFE